MTLYQLGERLGEWTVWIAMALAAVWIGTGRWRDYPRPDGRNTEQLTTVVRQRTQLVKRSVLGVAALWVLTMVVIDVWAVHSSHY
ncbi:hypothetical protein [Streptomyces sp. NBC_00343]|uniref:hypothetical protein n=1 Tax=Streptomyces sp. NBC_00343 TaxID=2975719 RepID=UPI002E288FFD|nr:hypothetical protein [Streptomyces sp. NBC_00343]